MQRDQRIARLDILATGDLQLRLGQAHRQPGFRCPLAGLTQQFIALFVLAQLVGGTCGAQVMHQRLAIMFRRSPQVRQRRAPLAFRQFAQTIVRSLGQTTLAMSARPGIDQRARGLQQPQQPVHRHRQQPDAGEQRQKYPEARFIAELVIGDQHITGAPADRPTEKADDGE